MESRRLIPQEASQRMADSHEVSHLEIYRILIEVKTTLDMAMKQRTEDKERDDLQKADIFKRLGGLENRMAQVVVLAAALSIILPLVVSAVSPRLHFGQPPIEQQR